MFWPGNCASSHSVPRAVAQFFAASHVVCAAFLCDAPVSLGGTRVAFLGRVPRARPMREARRNTMNIRAVSGSVICLLLVAGCIPSLHPLYRTENLIFDPEVIGEWRQADSPEKWQFTKRDNKSYTLVYTDPNGRQGKFIACIAEIQGKRFLDLFPDQTNTDAPGFYTFHLVPIHTIYLIRRTQPKLELAAVGYPWLDDYLSEHPKAIDHVVFGGRKLLTAPTEQVQAFVLAHEANFTEIFELKKWSERPE
jgi:hypothetical protein